MQTTETKSILTVDVEDWFHILENPAVPAIELWDGLESRVDKNVNRLIELFSRAGVKATFFWLGWVAERNKMLVELCKKEGHEIGSHGYAHLLISETSREIFREDVQHSKLMLEDIIGEEVRGFRASGFGITGDTRWAFDIIREAGFEYDSSVFPAAHGHGGIPDSQLVPYTMMTTCGPLIECPMSVVEMAGRRFSVFGGGYLRLAPPWLIKWGIEHLEKNNRPLIVYIHPREIDPDHPRLPLGLKRNFKCYVNLHTTFEKIEWLCNNYRFVTMKDYLSENIDLKCSEKTC
jgi:polysaccharide deacetylase family protein (PEP-CTERM system associated)